MPTNRPHNIQMRLSDGGYAWVETIRREHHCNRADVMRACLHVASKHERDVVAWLPKVAEVEPPAEPTAIDF